MRLLLLLCGELGVSPAAGLTICESVIQIRSREAHHGCTTGALRIVGAMLLPEDPAARMEISAKFY